VRDASAFSRNLEVVPRLQFDCAPGSAAARAEAMLGNVECPVDQQQRGGLSPATLVAALRAITAVAPGTPAAES
jgi:hypothetical protein